MTLDTVDGATFDSFATSLIVMAKAHPPLINPDIFFMLICRKCKYTYNIFII